jgi:hypothetical protein
VFVFFCALVSWIAFLLSHSYSQVTYNQNKIHLSVWTCGGPCEVLVTRLIKEKAHSV